jgi:beta-ribofuranosylaminobenzene 5'-phosphate synthase
MPLPGSVHVKTTARLHMGFIDMHGGLGRRFGSLGLSLDKPATTLTATAQSEFSAEGPSAQRVVEYAQEFAQRVAMPGAAHFTVTEAIPEHAGLGSGTQLALAVGVGMSRLYGLEMTAREVAALTARGARSGIGVGAFEQGGLLVDGGRGKDTGVPPIVARMVFPAQWRILMVYDRREQGVHGQQEVQAFSTLPEFPAELAAHIARLVLMQALPAVAEQDLTSFGAAVSEIQRIVGDHFAPAQGGGHYISHEVGAIMAWLGMQGVSCLGQSSWGPTGFAIVESAARAAQLLQDLQRRGTPLDFEICCGRNQGSIVGDGIAGSNPAG